MRFKSELVIITIIVCSLSLIGNCLACESKSDSGWVTLAEPKLVDIIDPPYWEMVITDKFKEIDFSEFSNYEFRLINEGEWNTIELFPYQKWIRKRGELILYFYTSFISKKPGEFAVERDAVSVVYRLCKNVSSVIMVWDHYFIGKIQARRIN